MMPAEHHDAPESAGQSVFGEDLRYVRAGLSPTGTRCDRIAILDLHVEDVCTVADRDRHRFTNVEGCRYRSFSIGGPGRPADRRWRGVGQPGIENPRRAKPKDLVRQKSALQQVRWRTDC
jgi:hypothetical protein